jgi:hypothetical protein
MLNLGPDFEIFRQRLNFRHEDIDTELHALANCSGETTLSSRFFGLPEKLLELGEVSQMKVRKGPKRKVIIAGIFPWGVGCHAESDGSFENAMGEPWCAVELKNFRKSTPNLTWKHLNTANVQDLHCLNGHASTAMSMTLSQRGFRIRIRRRVAESADAIKYACSEFPSNGDLQILSSRVGRTVFADVMAMIAFGLKVPNVAP